MIDSLLATTPQFFILVGFTLLLAARFGGMQANPGARGSVAVTSDSRLGRLLGARDDRLALERIVSYAVFSAWAVVGIVAMISPQSTEIWRACQFLLIGAFFADGAMILLLDLARRRDTRR